MLTSSDLERMEKIAGQAKEAEQTDTLWLVDKIRHLYKEYQLAAQANFQLRQALKVVL